MISFNIRLADKVICATVLYQSTREFCKDYLTDLSADISVSVAESDIDNESARSDEERRIEGLPPFTYPREYLETLALYRKIADALIDYGVILFRDMNPKCFYKIFSRISRSISSVLDGDHRQTHYSAWTSS